MIWLSKAQGAVEYLLIIALALGVIVPVAFLFFNLTDDSNAELESAQVFRVGETMVSSAKSMYFSGADSKVVIDVSMPDSVLNVTIYDDRELVFTVQKAYGIGDMLFISDINITGQAGNCRIEPQVGPDRTICDIPGLENGGNTKIRVVTAPDGRQVRFEEVTS